jgi:hypothetical protein
MPRFRKGEADSSSSVYEGLYHMDLPSGSFITEISLPFITEILS